MPPQRHHHSHHSHHHHPYSTDLRTPAHHGLQSSLQNPLLDTAASLPIDVKPGIQAAQLAGYSGTILSLSSNFLINSFHLVTFVKRCSSVSV